MATNLIETVKSSFTPDVVDRASARLGESPEGIRKAVDGGVPMVFAGLVYRSEHGGANALLSDAHQAANHHLPGSPATLFTGASNEMATGNGWANGLFGGAFTAITKSLASFAGIKTASANTLLNLLTPLSLRAVGDHALENNFTDGGLSAFLSEQKSSIAAALPAGTSMGRLFEEGGDHAAFATVRGHVPLTAERPLRVVPSTIWWVLLVIAVLGIIAYLVGR
ncbi:MAG TPA: DUF937 domain-containing protein [Chitinophagaceae bacterium]